MRFRKKPVEIEARHFSGENALETADIARWCGGAWNTSHRVAGEPRYVIYIDTLEGEMTVSPGDWVIKGVQGEFYPVKPDIFDATYEQCV